MAGPGRDCCSSRDCGESGPEEKEPNVTENTTRVGQSSAPLERDRSNPECANPSTPPHSITTSSSSTAVDAASLDIPKSSHRPHNLPDVNFGRIHPIKKSSRKTLRAKCILACCRRSGESSYSSSPEPPKLRSMEHHHAPENHHHGLDQHVHVPNHHHSSNQHHHAPDHHHHHHDDGNSCKSQDSETCCSITHIQEDTMKGAAFVTSGRDDGERGSTSFERVVLTVHGLKCGCCETGLSRALQNIAAIRNYQVNVVLAKIEFELDMSQLSVSEVTAHLQRATGYTFRQFEQPEGQVLELLVCDPSEIYRAGKPAGVTLLESQDKQTWNPSLLFSGRSSPALAATLDKPSGPTQQTTDDQKQRPPTSLYTHTVRVHYDASAIGARDVFEYYQQHVPSHNIQLAQVGAHPSLAIGAQQTKRALYLFLFTLAFTIPVLVFQWSPVDHDGNLKYDHASVALATVVQIIAIREFVPGALQSLIHSGRVEMDFLVAMSTTTAYVFSIVSYVFMVRKHPLETGCFFETSTLLVTLILLGRAVSEIARFRAAKTTSIRSLQTHEAMLVTSQDPTGSGRAVRKIDARLLQYGDVFRVLPHTRIVTDGKVTYGGSEVDESMITGESLPVAKGLGHEVHAGTMNGGGQLEVELSKLPHENSISEIATMVENAELSKPKIQALADNIAGAFVPVIATIGTVVFLIWLFAGRYAQHRRWGSAVVQALTYSIATLVVSCPCAIGLAVPMVVLIAGGTSARFGIIFRDSQKLEIARNTTDVVFDKTGTITTGELTVVEGEFYHTQHEQTESMIMGLLEGAQHPVAAAVLRWLESERLREKKETVVPMKMVDIKSEPGNGVEGVCEQTQIKVRAGNPQWLGVSVLESQHTLLCVTVSGILSATFRLEDRPRPGASKVVDLLLKRGIEVHMISGDGEGAVNQIAHTLNIPKAKTRWRLKPVDKQRYVHELQKDGKIVLFCGDGTNDSAALKQADVGVHMNQGSDVAKSASDVVLMSAHLHNILILLDISKAAYRRIIGNFSWSAIYNVIAILLASGALRKVRLAPAYAGLGELVSVLPVVLIAFQMKWRDYGRKYKGIQDGKL